MIGDAWDTGRHPVVVVNDTRNNVDGNFSIKDADSGETLLSKSFKVEKNGKKSAGFLAKTEKSKLWLIEWEVSGKKYMNHYFAYKPHVELDEYLKWLPLLKPKK